jgi:hypothetical protein
MRNARPRRRRWKRNKDGVPSCGHKVAYLAQGWTLYSCQNALRSLFFKPDPEVYHSLGIQLALKPNCN